MPDALIPRFQVGGALRDGALYIHRPADEELPAALLRGEFCYVLAPRQIGKSSLRVQVSRQLEQAGVRCASIDLTTIGSQNSTAAEWYFGILDELAGKLGLEGPEAFWREHELLSPVHRFSRYLSAQVLAKIPEQVVIFIDEIDAVLSQPAISRDDFFAAVRACYNARADRPEYNRLGFCLIGVALPGDLIADETRTPFNIGRWITLSDFTRQEIRPFAPGLAGGGADPARLLDEVFAWTDGHPYMTQKLCQALVAEGPPPGTNERERVAAMVQRIFLGKGRVLEPNLSFAEKYFARRADCSSTMLPIYKRVLAGEHVETQSQDPTLLALRMTGLAKVAQTDRGSALLVRNRIFASVFNLAWVKEQESCRVLSAFISRWLESNRSDDLVLRGQALRQAQEWARGRLDLTSEENAFLLAGSEVARRDAERAHQAELGRRLAIERADIDGRMVAAFAFMIGLLIMLFVSGMQQLTNAPPVVSP